MIKRGQAWGFDLIIASIIFLTGIILFYLYSLNYPTEGTETLNILTYEGDTLASSLMSEGYPEGWDSSNVVRIGILTDSKIDDDKLSNFQSMAQNNYQQTKQIFNIHNDYYIDVSDPSVSIIGTQPSPPEPENLIKVTRYSIYNNQPVTIDVYIWN